MILSDDFKCPYCGHTQSVDEFIEYMYDGEKLKVVMKIQHAKNVVELLMYM